MTELVDSTPKLGSASGLSSTPPEGTPSVGAPPEGAPLGSTPVLGTTPSQTVGPFVAIGLEWPDGPDVVPAGTPGAVVLSGQVVDGAGELVLDAMLEIWHADPEGGLVP